MTRDELVEYVQSLPHDITFLVSSDEEGNSYREMRVGDVEQAYKDGYEWQSIHPDDLEEYSDFDLKDVVIFW